MENVKNSKKSAGASPELENVRSQPKSVHSENGNGQGSLSDDYKTFDISKAVRQDVRAAVSLLSLILDNPQILDLVVAEIEKIRSKLIEQETLPKREDFHPELNVSK